MRKVLGLVVSLAALTFTVAAAHAKDQIRVVVGYYSAATQGIFEGMAKDFKAAHPDVDVKIEVVQWDNLQQRLTTDIAGGTAPDIAMIGTRWLVDFRAQRHRRAARRLHDARGQGPLHRELHGPLDHQRQALRPARRGVGARHVLQQGLCLRKPASRTPRQLGRTRSMTPRRSRRSGGDTYGFALQGKEIETDAYWYYSLWTHGGELIQDGKSRSGKCRRHRALPALSVMIDQGLTEPDPTGYNRQDIEAAVQAGPHRNDPHRALAARSDQDRGTRPQLRHRPDSGRDTKATYGVTDSSDAVQGRARRRTSHGSSWMRPRSPQVAHRVHHQGGLPTGDEGRGRRSASSPTIPSSRRSPTCCPTPISLRPFRTGSRWPTRLSGRYSWSIRKRRRRTRR